LSKPQPASSLFAWLSKPGAAPACALHGLDASVALAALGLGTSLDVPTAALRQRTILVALDQQIAAALALIELDGLARRLVLCPPGLSQQHRTEVMAAAGVDTIISDRDGGEVPHGILRVVGGTAVRPVDGAVDRDVATEWLMLTSGTSGAPKLVQHSLASLTGAILADAAPASPCVWGTFYDVRRFGGLQILLRSVLGGSALVLSDARETMGQYLVRAGALGVTHLSGTPSHWRNALAYASVRAIAPRYIRLSGEIADRAILDALKARFPRSEVVHAYASTEGGVGFAVDDGCEGFPVRYIGGGEVELKLVDGSLRIRSARAAARYVGTDAAPLKDAEGFIDTGDLVEQRGERCYFVGRRGGIINVGGLKVAPEEVEAVINRHPGVRACLVYARKNLITGAIVMADVVLRSDGTDAGPDVRETDIRREILLACRQALASYKVPASIRFVAGLDMAPTGKSVRAPALAPAQQDDGLVARESSGAPDAGRG
jgi:acyl-CoA synthetase (AMP-forming)/AMP-acid ligase II